eukprot:1138938-Pelagomonas_calceolata.AAC.1
MQPICKVVVVSKGFDTISPRYAWFQSSLSSSGKVETFVADHTQVYERISVGKVVTIMQQLGKSVSSGIEADDLRFLCIDRQSGIFWLHIPAACSTWLAVVVVCSEDMAISIEHIRNKENLRVCHCTCSPVSDAANVINVPDAYKIHICFLLFPAE